MKALLVIDMQEDYIGQARNKKKYSYDEILISHINNRISQYSSDYVVYVVNRFFWERKNTQKKLVDGLNVVSNAIFEKRKQNCLSNKKIKDYLSKLEVTELEVVGIDGNYCVAASAIGARNEGFKVILNEKCTGIANSKKYLKTRKKFEKEGVIIK